ncbi:hypothetical protein FS837_004102 [Tulasnella sp. UAMH 9824]|nr:hypothetical protein FS837_004102 [Tulasnella sp. UAMH 9824]
MFAQLRNFAVLLVLAVVSQLVYALPQATVSPAASTPAASTPAASTPAAATTTGPPRPPPTVYTYTTIIDGVTYENVDTYTPTYEPTVMPTLTLQGSIMPYAEFTSLYWPTSNSSPRSASPLPAGILWAGATTLLGFVLGVRACLVSPYRTRLNFLMSKLVPFDFPLIASVFSKVDSSKKLRKGLGGQAGRMLRFFDTPHPEA